MITYYTQSPEMRDPVLLTRKGNTIYVHLYRDTEADGIVLRPFDVMPAKATLLNNGAPLDCSVDKVPFYHRDNRPYLRIRRLPTNELLNEVIILKLDFDGAWCE